MNNVSDHSSTKQVALVAIAIWTSLSAVIFAASVREELSHRDTTIHELSRMVYRHVVLARAWNARNGGVYVPVSDHLQPNPYLNVDYRDLDRPDGVKLTLVNPAYMTRQLSEMSYDEDGIRFRLPSLNPLNPVNQADDWDSTALRAMEEGNATEYGEWFDDGEQTNLYRYIAPLTIDKSCQRCHDPSTNPLGSIKGGVSLTMPASIIGASMSRIITHNVARSTVLWLVGIALIALGYRRLRAEEQVRESTIKQLEQALDDVRVLKSLIPICAHCGKVRNDGGYWKRVEDYVRDAGVVFTHGICPDCMQVYHPQYSNQNAENGD
jgi:hypothetical protein